MKLKPSFPFFELLIALMLLGSSATLFFLGLNKKDPAILLTFYPWSMKILAFTFMAIGIFGCSNKPADWSTYGDNYNIGSISMPSTPIERVDTVIASAYKIVQVIYAVDGEDNLSFSYNLYFPTDIKEFDLFEMKKDSNKVKMLFESMIKGVEQNSNNTAIAKTRFIYPEPGMKITLRQNQTKNISVLRLIIFDNCIVSTVLKATADFPKETEERFFKSLTMNPENRYREFILGKNIH